MADAQEPQAATPAGQEPSMEEILASIRKIIADEPDATNGAAAGDVLELTQMVQDDGSVVDVKPAPEPAKEPSMPLSPPPKAAEPEKKPAAAAAPPAATLVSEPAAKASASALTSLANTVEIERLSNVTPTTSTFLGNGAKTLEEMTVELMKPLLKDWLDKNLPATVDRLVQKEIERIARKAEKDGT